MLAAWDGGSESWIPPLVSKPGLTARPSLSLSWDKPWLPQSLGVFGEQGNLLPRDGWSHMVAALLPCCPSSSCDIYLSYCHSSSSLAAKNLSRRPASSSSLAFLKYSFTWLCRVLAVACGILIASREIFCCRTHTLKLWCMSSVVVAHGPSCSMARGTLVPCPGIEPTSPAFQGSLDCWATREVPNIYIYLVLFIWLHLVFMWHGGSLVAELGSSLWIRDRTRDLCIGSGGVLATGSPGTSQDQPLLTSFQIKLNVTRSWAAWASLTELSHLIQALTGLRDPVIPIELLTPSHLSD